MLLTAYKLLNNPDIADKWSSRFKAVLCDEFQDIDDIQLEIVKRLCVNNKNILYLGDPDQSIYGFRRAVPDVFVKFKNYFEELGKQVNIRKLEKNFRSSPEIKDLHFIDDLVSNSMFNDQNIADIFDRYIKSLIIIDYHLFEKEELSVLEQIIKHIGSVRVISQHRSDIYKKEKHVKSFRDQFNIFENIELSQKYGKTSNSALSLINELNEIYIVNSSLPGEKPYSYIADSLSEKINWIKSKTFSLSNSAIITPTQKRCLITWDNTFLKQI